MAESVHDDYSIRRAALPDAEALAFHRAAMFFDMGRLAETDMDPLVEASRIFFSEALSDGNVSGWVVEQHTKIVASGVIALYHAAPFPGCLKMTESVYIYNMYTEPMHRRKGLAKRLMKAMLDWCRERGVSSISLHASDDGRALYESLGFESTNEMRLKG